MKPVHTWFAGKKTSTPRKDRRILRAAVASVEMMEKRVMLSGTPLAVYKSVDNPLPGTITASASTGPVTTSDGTQAGVEGASTNYDIGTGVYLGTDSINYDYNWGDGTSDTTGSQSGPFDSAGHTTHTYAEEGTYTEISTLTDPSTTQSSTSTETFMISDPAVVPAAGVQVTTVEGQATPVTLATFTDPGGLEMTSDYSATVDWGDGSGPDSMSTAIVDNMDGTFSVTGAHGYLEETTGTPNNVTITIHHDAAPDAFVTDTAVVTDPAVVPAVGPDFPLTLTEGQSTGQIEFASFTDPGGLESTSDYSATINFGDEVGNTEGNPVIEDNGDGTYGVYADYTYEDESTPGPAFTVTTTIHHDSAPDASVTSSATVLDAPIVGKSATLPIFTEGAGTTATVATFYDQYPQPPIILGNITPAIASGVASEPDGAADFTATITWGDGNVSAGTITQSMFDPNKYTVTGTNTYAEEGLDVVSVHIADDGGSTADVTDQALVIDAPLAATPNTLAGIEGENTAGSVQTLTVSGATGGSFNLLFSGATTTPLTYNDTAADVQTALDGLSTIGGVGNSVTVSEFTVGSSNVYEVVFNVAPGTAEPPIIPLDNTLTGPHPAVHNASYFGVIASFTDADPAGQVGDYIANIDWGDGSAGSVGTIVANSTGGFDVLGNHVYGDDGVYTPVVSIQDAGSGTFATSTVNVADPAVVAAAPMNNAFSGVEGANTGPLVLATFTDPGGAEPNAFDPDPNLYDHYTATIDWGDGSTDDQITSSGNPDGSITYNAATQTFSVNANHLYVEESAPEHAGSQPYQITVTVHHESAPDSNVVTDTATISDPAVIPNAGTTFTGVEGQNTGPLKVAVFSDPGSPVGEPVADYSATVDWGDGTTPDTNATITYLSGNFYSVTDSHTWGEETHGNKLFFVKVTVHHEEAPDSVPTTDLATVLDPSVIAGPAIPVTGVEGQSTGLVAIATFTDPGGPESTADYSATINWGDSTPVSQGTITYLSGVFTVSGTHTYAEESGPDHPNSQPYPIVVTINHETSTPASVTSGATIADPAAVAVGGKTYNGTKNVSLGSVVVATFTDPGGEEDTGAFSASINWGDASGIASGSITVAGGVFTVKGTHTYSSTGTFHPTVVIHHEQAPDSNTVTDTVNITNPAPPPPVLTGGNGAQLSGIEGRLVGGTVVSFTDTNLSAVASNFTATVTWGDGSSSSGNVVKDSAGHFHITDTNHAYAEPGTYNVSVSIKDNTSSATTSAGNKIKIVDAPLDSGAGVSITKTHKVAFSNTTVGTFRDQDSLNTTAADYTGTINWGDGTTSAATFVQTGSTFNVGSFWKITGGHTYATAKTYTVKITLHDLGSPSAPITITTTIKVV